MADRYPRHEGKRWRNEHERSSPPEQHHEGQGVHEEGAWQYGSQGSLRDNERWQNQSPRGWQGGAQAGHSRDFRRQGSDDTRVQYGRGYGSGYGGYGSQGSYSRPQEERFSEYSGSNYGYGRTGSPANYPRTYEGGGYARDRYYATRPEHDLEHHHGHWGHDNPEWEREMEAAKHARWMGEGYGGPIEGPHFEDTRADTRRAEQPSYSGALARARRPGSQHWPKSYQRSDERIREDIYERLLQDSYVDCSNITVAVSSGVVTLEGTVPERHMKHQVENIADDCSGVKDIDNKLRVSQIDRVHPDDGVVSGVRSSMPDPTTHSKKP